MILYFHGIFEYYTQTSKIQMYVHNYVDINNIINNINNLGGGDIKGEILGLYILNKQGETLLRIIPINTLTVFLFL